MIGGIPSAVTADRDGITGREFGTLLALSRDGSERVDGTRSRSTGSDDNVMVIGPEGNEEPYEISSLLHC